MFQEGHAIVKSVAHDAETVINEVKQVQKEISGFWKFINGIFGIKPKISQKIAEKEQKQPLKVAGNKNKSKKVAIDQNEIYMQIATNLATLYKNIIKAKQLLKELENTSQTVMDQEQAIDNSLQRVFLEDQIERMMADVRQTMCWNTPTELGDLYTKVNNMFDVVSKEQQAARDIELRKERLIKWQRRKLIESVQDRAIFAVITIIIVLEIWAMMLIIVADRKARWGF